MKVYGLLSSTHVIFITITVVLGVSLTTLSPVAAQRGASMYVCNFGSDTVSVIDTNTNTVGKPIPVGNGPSGIAFDPIHDRMYVTNGDGVSVIDVFRYIVVGTIPIPGGGIAFDPTHNRMYVLTESAGRGAVSVIDTNTNTVVGSPIPVGDEALDIEFDPTHNRMYVTNIDSDSVSVIDTNTNTVLGSPIPVLDPYGIALDPTHNRMYVVNHRAANVSVIDTNTNTVVGLPISVGESAYGIAFDPTHERMYVTVGGSINTTLHWVSVIDTNSMHVIGSPIKVGITPNAIAFDPTHDRMYVVNYDSDSISVIDTNTNTVLGPPLVAGDAPGSFVGIAFKP
jgi:YVTN family beta-propeller protein